MNADDLAAVGCKASASGACGCIPYGGCVAHRNRDAAYWEGEYDDCSRRYDAVVAERDTLRGEVERLRDAAVDQHVILPDVQRDLLRVAAIVASARAEALEWQRAGWGSASDYDKGAQRAAEAILLRLGDNA